MKVKTDSGRRSYSPGTPRIPSITGGRGQGSGRWRASSWGSRSVRASPTERLRASGEGSRLREHTVSRLQALCVPTGGADCGVQARAAGAWCGSDAPR